MRDLLADFGELAPVLARGDPRGPIETTFRQELEAELKRAEYQPWMISIAYEVEARTAGAARLFVAAAACRHDQHRPCRPPAGNA
jgi:hypothetical protein